MEKLSASLQSKIESRPTKTILREDNEKVNVEFIDIIKTYPVRKINIPETFDGRMGRFIISCYESRKMWKLLGIRKYKCIS